jgi:hypothetical protein
MPVATHLQIAEVDELVRVLAVGHLENRACLLLLLVRVGRCPIVVVGLGRRVLVLLLRSIFGPLSVLFLCRILRPAMVSSERLAAAQGRLPPEHRAGRTCW